MNGTTTSPPPAYYPYWGSATDTHEIPVVLCERQPPTVELHMLDLSPAVRPTVRFARLRRAARRIAASPSLRRSADAALATAGIVATAVLCTRGAAYLAVMLTGGIQ